MSDVKIVISAENANSEAIINAVSTAVEKLGAEIKTTADIARREKDASKAFSSGWVSLGRDLSELTNNTFELLKKGIYGIKTAYNSLKEGADFSEAQQNFRAYAASIGKDADGLMQKMRQASKNQVSDMELMESATKALRLGVAKDAGTIGKLLEIADAKGDLFGKGLKETFDTIVGAISKGQGRTLIELGVLPESFGRASNAADLLKNKVLLLKAVLQQGQTDIKALSSVGDTSSDDFNRLDAAISNTTANLKILLSDAAKPLVSQLLEGTVPAVNSAVDSLREWTKANLENKDKLQDHIETLGSVKSAVEYAIAAYAGWKLGAMVESLVIMTNALRNMTRAQLAANAAALANPYVLAGAAIAGSAMNLYGKYSNYKDAAAANDYAAQKNEELKDMGEGSQVRYNILGLEKRLEDLKRELSVTESTLKAKEGDWRLSPARQNPDSNQGQAYSSHISKLKSDMEEYQKAIEKTENQIDSLKKKLAEIKITNKNAKLAPDETKPTDPTNENNFDGIITGAEDAEKAMRKLREEALKAQKNLFDTLLANFKKELAAISDIEDPLVKYFQAAELAEKTTLSLAAAVGTMTGGGATSLYQALTGVEDAAFAAEESMFDLFQRSKREADEAARSVKELKEAYDLVQKANVLLLKDSNTVGMELLAAGTNWISGGLFTAQGGNSSDAKDAIKDIEEPLSKTIAEAVSAGFANADFSNLELTLGSILSTIITKTVSQSSPVMDAAGSINFGNLGLNLAASAVSSVLTRSGRFFGGREEHGKEAIGQVSDLINNLTKAYDQSYLSEIYSVYAPQDRKNAIEAARKKARGASASYTWSDSGNGVWSDKTRTYALVDNGAGDALRAIQEAVKAVETISKNKELDLKLEAAQGFEYKVLKEQVAAYQTSLQSLYYGPSSYSDSATDRTEATRTVQTELAQMIRELASATAERSTNISNSYAQYAPWLTMTGTRDQGYENWQALQTSYFDRDINSGLLDIVKSSGKSKYDLQALQISDPEAYKEEYQDYLDRQMEAYEEVMERQAAIFDDLTKSYEERSAALQAFETAQEGYYQAKLDAMAAEQAAEEAIKAKQQEADLRKAERMEAALSLVGEVAQRGDKIVILQGGDSTAALKELLEKFSDDPEVSAILQAAITNSEAKARWGN